MDAHTNSLNWFEIPATDLGRAKAFYETIFDFEMTPMAMGEHAYEMFPSAPETGKANGAVASGPGYAPSKEGAVIYLNANPDLSVVEARIAGAGGTVTAPKTSIGPNGFVAYFEDTEGNKVGLHSVS